jgi:hypothetical protein
MRNRTLNRRGGVALSRKSKPSVQAALLQAAAALREAAGVSDRFLHLKLVDTDSLSPGYDDSSYLSDDEGGFPLDTRAARLALSEIEQMAHPHKVTVDVDEKTSEAISYFIGFDTDADAQAMLQKIERSPRFKNGVLCFKHVDNVCAKDIYVTAG